MFVLFMLILALVAYERLTTEFKNKSNKKKSAVVCTLCPFCYWISLARALFIQQHRTWCQFTGTFFFS